MVLAMIFRAQHLILNEMKGETFNDNTPSYKIASKNQIHN
jgi:hypothetical protein